VAQIRLVQARSKDHRTQVCAEDLRNGVAVVHNALEAGPVVDQAPSRALLCAGLEVAATHLEHSPGVDKSIAWVAVVLCTLEDHAVGNIDLLERCR
jgi:hypothetical protein